MKAALKRLFSKPALTIILAALLLLSALNTYLIFDATRSSLSTSMVNYDFVLSQNSGNYRLKNMLTGAVAVEPQSASTALNNAMSEGKSVYLNPGTYELTDDVWVTNKVGAKIISDGATIQGNGHKIIVYGTDYTESQRALLSGFTLINGTIRVENSLGTTIQGIIFANTSTGLEFANTDTWTEFNKVESCQFINATEGIAFRTPAGNATGSYASSQIERCSFNLRDFSVGIKVESRAEFSDSQLQNVRFWLGQDGERSNQTAIYLDGSMCQTVLLGVVFESFTTEPIYLFGMDIGADCKAAPILDSGVSFLGNWTARIHNPHGEWISGAGAVFKRENIDVPVGVNNQYGGNVSIGDGQTRMASFKPQITVSGSFSGGEAVTVRIRIEYIDQTLSNPVTVTFTTSGSSWLSDNEMMQLYPSQSIVWAIWVDAKTTAASTNTRVSVSGYGTA